MKEKLFGATVIDMAFLQFSGNRAAAPIVFHKPPESKFYFTAPLRLVFEITPFLIFSVLCLAISSF